MVAVLDAFRFARKHAAQHMGVSERARLRWGETSITEIVIGHAARAVSVVPFTQNAEARSGGDWVWWWVDGASAYGMLVQAKRVTITGSGWSFGFDHKAQTASLPQRDALFATAAALDLLPVYALYLGTGDYRRWEPCPTGHTAGWCLNCVKRTVSLMPALLADSRDVNDADSTYRRSVALEEILTSVAGGDTLIPAVKSHLSRDLASFLLFPQRGTRAVTRSMLDRVLEARQRQFGLGRPSVMVASGGAHDVLGPVFTELPDDTLHGGVRYFPHTLNPLRHAPPGYVLEILAGEANANALAEQLPETLAGIVVVQLPLA